MKPELRAIYDANQRDFGHLTPPQLMALTLWAEARGEIIAGKIAIATVILERVNHRKWDGSTIHEVCLWPKQFSCFNPDDRQRGRMVRMAKDFQAAVNADLNLRLCLDVAACVLNGVYQRDYDLMTSHCCQYLTAKAANGKGWWSNMRLIKQVGNHLFFAEKKS